MKKNSVFTAIALLLKISLCLEQTANVDIVIGKRANMYSKVLNENRELQIYLPSLYSNNSYKKYPVIYLILLVAL